MKTIKIVTLALPVLAVVLAGLALAQTPPGKAPKAQPPQRGINSYSPPPQRMTKVPGLSGINRDQVPGVLEKFHLVMGSVSDVQSDKPAGTVVSQKPEPERQVPWGTPVDVGVAIPIDVQRIPVPRFVGRPVDVAKLLLVKSGLTGGALTYEASAQPEGQVINQSIPPQTLVPIKTAIDLTIAKPKTVSVPGLVGKSLQEAQLVLEKLELGIGSTTSQTTDGTAGEVLGQDVAPETEVPVGTLIGLTVSQLPDLRVVPDVVGLPREEANKLLVSAGLVAGNIAEEASSAIAAGGILSQNPSKGSKLPPGSPVDLKVAKPLLTVPQVTGMSQADGRELLAQTGFTQVPVSTRFSFFSPAGEILEQSPIAGNQFANPQPVTLIVAVNLPPWTQLPLILLSAGSIGMLLVRRVRGTPPQSHTQSHPDSTPVTTIRSEIKLDSGKSGIRNDDHEGLHFEVRIKSRIDEGISSVRVKD